MFVRRFQHDHLGEPQSAGPLSPPGAFAPLPASMVGLGHAALWPGAVPAAAVPSIYEVARQAAVREAREREFRRYLDRALFSVFN
jgi:hypothetical protein